MKTHHQFMRFAVVGVANSLIHVSVVFVILQLTRSGQMAANTIAYLVASTFSYYFNSRWSFKKPLQWSSYFRFQSVNVMNLVASAALGAAGDYFHWNWLATVLLLFAAMPLISFMLHFSYTFRTPK